MIEGNAEGNYRWVTSHEQTPGISRKRPSGGLKKMIPVNEAAHAVLQGLIVSLRRMGDPTGAGAMRDCPIGRVRECWGSTYALGAFAFQAGGDTVEDARILQ